MTHPIPTSLMRAMREATHDIHQRLEQRLKISMPDAGRADYVRYIRALWGWLAPVEARLWEGGWPANLNVEQRSRKRIWLEEDLGHAGLDVAGIPLCLSAPSFTSMGERIGWAYVIEGAQLGGQVLKKRLAPSLGPWTPRWLDGYGSEIAANWKLFAAYVDSIDDPLVSQAATQAAGEAFATLATWLEEQGAFVSGS